MCAQLLQALFTDLAVHNDATQPYKCTMGGDAVSLAGRLPHFPRALKHHAELCEAQAELAGKPFLVSIYKVGWSWQPMDLCDSTACGSWRQLAAGISILCWHCLSSIDVNLAVADA